MRYDLDRRSVTANRAGDLSRALAVALLAALGGRAEAQFTIPVVPGWTDTSPGIPVERLPPLSAEQLAGARGEGVVASFLDLRGPARGFKPNLSVRVVEGGFPLSMDGAEQMLGSLRSNLTISAVSKQIVTRPGMPRIRLDYRFASAFGNVRQIMLVIPSDTHTAVAVYTFDGAASPQVLATADAHAASIAPAPGFRPPRASPVGEIADPLALLVTAAVRGDIPAMRAALARGADVNGEWLVNTPLSMAAANGQVGAVDFLLRHGAKIDAKYGLPKRTALQEAALKGQLEVVRFLVESGADVNAQNKNGRTALFYATTPPAPLTKPSNSEAIAAYLISKGAVIEPRRGLDGADFDEGGGAIPSEESGPKATALAPFLPGKLWMSPDGRWGAAFPGTPEKLDLKVSGGAGDGYRLLTFTPEGPIQFVVTLGVADVLSERPLAAQVRQILKETTKIMVGTVGGDVSTLETTWATFGKGLPKLDHKFSYVREGVELETVGFMTMVGVEVVRVAATYPAVLADLQRPQVRYFLQSFITIDSKSEPTAEEYALAVARGAGAVREECPEEMVTIMRAGVEEQGGVHAGAFCFTISGTMSETMKGVERARIEAQRRGTARSWKDGQSGAKRLVERYSGDGIAWWLFPIPGSAGSTALVVQLMR